jgi:hypothetical protein
LADVAAFHVTTNSRQSCFVVWDGDVTDNEAQQIVNRAASKLGIAPFNFYRLPGDDVPERVVVTSILGNSEAMRQFASVAGVPVVQAQSALLSVLGEGNHHSMPYEIGRQLGLEESDVLVALAQAACRSGAVDLGNISEAVAGLL